MKNAVIYLQQMIAAVYTICVTDVTTRVFAVEQVNAKKILLGSAVFRTWNQIFSTYYPKHLNASNI